MELEGKYKMSRTKGYYSKDFDSLNCVICGQLIYDRMGIVSRKQTHFDSVLRKPIAVCSERCKKKYIKKRQKELNKLV